jgi:hypothetical protein
MNLMRSPRMQMPRLRNGEIGSGLVKAEEPTAYARSVRHRAVTGLKIVLKPLSPFVLTLQTAIDSRKGVFSSCRYKPKPECQQLLAWMSIVC